MGKHIQESNIKTINGETLIGKGDIELASDIKVDNKTIYINDEGEIQLGKMKKQGSLILSEIEDISILLSSIDNECYLTNDSVSIEEKENGEYVRLHSNLIQISGKSEQNKTSISKTSINIADEKSGVEITRNKIKMQSNGFLGSAELSMQLGGGEMVLEDNSKNKVTFLPDGFIFNSFKGVSKKVYYPITTSVAYIPISINGVKAKDDGNIEIFIPKPTLINVDGETIFKDLQTDELSVGRDFGGQNVIDKDLYSRKSIGYSSGTKYSRLVERGLEIKNQSGIGNYYPYKFEFKTTNDELIMHIDERSIFLTSKNNNASTISFPKNNKESYMVLTIDDKEANAKGEINLGYKERIESLEQSLNLALQEIETLKTKVETLTNS